MKKNRFLILITVFSFLFLPCNILAIETVKVVFNTTFENGVDSNSIKGISIMMDDNGANSYDNIALTKDNNYKYEINGLLNGNIQINDMFVLNDNSGKYDIKYEQNRKSVNEIEIRIIVSLANKQENTTTIKVNEAVLGDIFGDKYVEKHTQVIPSYGTDEGYTPPAHPIEDDKTSNASTTTSNSTNGNGSSNEPTTNEYGQTDKDLEEQKKKLEESRKEAKKQEEIDKRNNIYTIILIAVIIILIIAIIFVIIKFANANK